MHLRAPGFGNLSLTGRMLFRLSSRFWKKEREEWEITERKKWPRDLPGFEPGTFRGRMLFRLSHKSRSMVNGVRIRLSQSILLPLLTSHLLPYTLHARFGNFFFFERKKKKSEKLPNGKSDQETCRDSTGDLSLTGRMLFRLSHKSRSMVNGVRIRLSQSILLPSLTSHLLPYTLHARFGNFLAKEKTTEKDRTFDSYRGYREELHLIGDLLGV